MTMDCRGIRETISAWVDGEASPAEAASVRGHLASCERCRVLERQMRVVGAGVRQVPGPVPDGFRKSVFARLEAEGALPPRKKVFSISRRWAAVPLAAAAALGLFLLISRERVRTAVPQGPAAIREGMSASAERNGIALSTEDRKMLALLDILEDPAALDDDGEAEEMELLEPGGSTGSPSPGGGGRSGV